MSQTFSADPEPGPEVTHVRDRHGVTWRHGDDLWWADIGKGYEDFRTWWDILRRGPLIDATEEA